MKNKILSAFLILILLLSLAGCGNQEQIKADESDISSQTDLISETEPEGTTEKDNQNSFTMNTNNQKPKDSNPSTTKAQAHEQSITSQPLNPTETDKTAEASTQKQTEPPAPTKPAEKPKPTETSAPVTETEPAFDIDYWISYAQNYAKSVGLRLDSSAVDCWDNPIPANSKCKYLERDIKSRLNRYAKDEDITDVWIWAEKVSDNSYEIYIGYA